MFSRVHDLVGHSSNQRVFIVSSSGEMNFVGQLFVVRVEDRYPLELLCILACELVLLFVHARDVRPDDHRAEMFSAEGDENIGFPCLLGCGQDSVGIVPAESV